MNLGHCLSHIYCLPNWLSWTHLTPIPKHICTMSIVVCLCVSLNSGIWFSKIYVYGNRRMKTKSKRNVRKWNLRKWLNWIRSIGQKSHNWFLVGKGERNHMHITWEWVLCPLLCDNLSHLRTLASKNVLNRSWTNGVQPILIPVSQVSQGIELNFQMLLPWEKIKNPTWKLSKLS